MPKTSLRVCAKHDDEPVTIINRVAAALSKDASQATFAEFTGELPIGKDAATADALISLALRYVTIDWE